MSGKVKFLYNAFFDKAALSTVPAGCFKPGWPVGNVQNTVRRRVWKTNGTGNVKLRVDFGQVRVCGALGLVEFVLAPATPVIIRAFADAWVTETYAEAFEAIGPVEGWGVPGWGMDGWGGYPSAEDLELYPRMTSAFFFAQRAAARYWEVEIQNGAGEAGEFYLGRVFLNDYWEPAHNFLYGAKLERVDDSKDEESLGGVLWTDEGSQYLKLDFDLKYLTDVEAFGQFVKLAHYVGRRKDFIVQLLDFSQKHQRLTTIYGRFTANPASTLARPLAHEAKFSIREVL